MGAQKDMLSNFPDKVLCHILSYLPTKCAVQTCVLSSRWKNLWTSVSNLDFDDELFVQEEKVSKISSTNVQADMCFSNFVNDVLRRNKSDIYRFRLKYTPIRGFFNVNVWIQCALWRNIQELDLCVSLRDSKPLHHSLFTCNTLVYLKVGTKFVLNIPTSVSLPSLKKMHLNSIEFSDDESTLRLFSGCPVLEELYIKECGLQNIHTLNISALPLKRLNIQCAIVDEYDTEFCEYKLIIDAPCLEHLFLSDYVAEDYTLKNLKSLIEARIHVDLSSQKLEQRGHTHYGENMFRLMKGISNVKVLHLSGDSMEALNLSCCELPALRNVTLLELDVNKHVGWQFLPDLLKSLPNLGAVFFRKGLVHSGGGMFHWSPPEWVPNCLLFHLRTIEIWAFQGQKGELELMKYLLKNATVLHKLRIRSDLSKEARLEIVKKLLLLPRGSNVCRVLFS